MKFFLILLVFLYGCASAPKNTYLVKKIYSSSVYIRRPVSAPADPSVSGGGEDFKTKPLPNSQFDCLPFEELWRETNGLEIQNCLKNLKNTLEVRYLLRREAQPYFELEEDEKTPACLKSQLFRIPVPREILFRAPGEFGKIHCYASHLDLEAERWMDIKLPFHHFKLQLEFPLPRPPLSHGELIGLLKAWSLTPFWSESQISSVIVPDALCLRCFKKKEFPDLSLETPWPDSVF